MPKKRRRNDDDDDKESSESEYEEQDDEEEEEEEDDDDGPAEEFDEDAAEEADGKDDEEEDECDAEESRPKKVRSATAAASNKPASSRKKKPRGSSIAALSTDDRKTEAGGYSHTIESRLRISQANRGNTPWNKGRKWSDLDKAKITAGVRARNHLLAKRQREAFGLSEAEADRLKKQVKYVREKVRRIRVDNDKQQSGRRENREAWAKLEDDARKKNQEPVARKRGKRRAALSSSKGSSSDFSASDALSSSEEDEDDSAGSDNDSDANPESSKASKVRIEQRNGALWRGFSCTTAAHSSCLTLVSLCGESDRHRRLVLSPPHKELQRLHRRPSGRTVRRSCGRPTPWTTWKWEACARRAGPAGSGAATAATAGAPSTWSRPLPICTCHNSNAVDT
jgi:NUMOD3 motif